MKEIIIGDGPGVGDKIQIVNRNAFALLYIVACESLGELRLELPPGASFYLIRGPRLPKIWAEEIPTGGILVAVER